MIVDFIQLFHNFCDKYELGEWTLIVFQYHFGCWSGVGSKDIEGDPLGLVVVSGAEQDG